MRRRRSPGDGAVYKSSNGRWVALLELPRGPSGNRRRKMRRARTRAEAQRKLREMKAELDGHGSVGDGKRTVAQAADTYATHLAKRRRAKSTATSHEWMIDLIKSGLGWRRLADLSVDDCDQFIAACATGLKPGSRSIGPEHLRRVRSMLVSVLRNEVRLDSIARNVADLSNLPEAPPHRPRRKAERRALTREELRQLVDASSGAVGVFVDLTGRNGLRPAEARGLTWNDMDLAASILSVETQMDEHDEPGDVKTADSRRSIRLDAKSAARIEQWHDNQAQLQERADSRWMHPGLVITTRYGTPINRNNMARSIRILCDRTDITPAIVPYELRHTAISHQADAGRSSWDIADWCGSSERMISQVYRHRLKEISDLMPADED